MSESNTLEHLYQVSYGDSRFSYRLCHVDTTTKRSKIAIHVYPNGKVQVDAPIDATPAAVKQAVIKRARWVIEHLNAIKIRQEHVLPREYVSGESLFYLGRRHQLKLHTKVGKGEVKLYRGQLCIYGENLSGDRIKALLENWYRERATKVFDRRLIEIQPQIVWLKQVPPFKLLTMKTQWGSCSPSGTLLLNPHLVKAPTECIDYVLLHELCHLQEHNHSPRYYELLSHQMPQWEAVKGRLDGMAEMLLNI